MKSIRILHIDDHILFIRGIHSLLSINPHFEWVGEATSAGDGLEKAKKLQPDLILIDYFMPEKTGIEIGQDLLKILPEVKLVLLTMESSHLTILDAKKKGFFGWISKSSDADELISSLEKVGLHNQKIFPKINQTLVGTNQTPFRIDQLTKREKEIIFLVSKGLTSQEIADKLFISLLTVNTHRRNLLNKLGLKNFAQLAGLGSSELNDFSKE